MVLTTWWVRAAVIAVTASAILNLSSYLPWLKDIKPTRIRARWVGYVGLSFAFALWVLLNPEALAWIALKAWIIIAVTTLLPNTLIHWREESLDRGKPSNNGRLPPFIIVPMESCEDILADLVDPRRDLTIALEAISQAAVRAKRLAGEPQAQILACGIRESLDTALVRVEETRESLEQIYQAVSAFWHTIDGAREQWRSATA